MTEAEIALISSIELAEKVDETLLSKVDVINFRTDEQETLVHIAVDYQAIAYIKHFVEMGVDVDSLDDSGISALMLASLSGCDQAVPILLDALARVDYVDRYGNNALHLAISAGHTKPVKSLLDFDASLIGSQTKQNMQPLHLAVLGGQLQMLKLLNRYEPDYGARSREGKTPFYCAAECSGVDVLRFLYSQSELEINVSNFDGVTPLMLVTMRGQARLVRLLLGMRADRQAITYEKYENALYMAAQNGDLDSLKLLVSSPEDILLRCAITASSPLFIAVNHKKHNVVKYLLDISSMNIDSASSMGHAPIHEAVLNDDSEMIKLLASHGANLNRSSTFGESPLFLAAKRGFSSAVSTLIELKAHLNTANDKDGMTPIAVASSLGHVECVELLLKAGANLLKAKDAALQPLMLAVMEGRAEVIDVFMRAGITPGITPYTGNNLYFTAATGKDSKSLQALYLADSKKDGFDSVNYLNQTPLFWAVRASAYECVDYLTTSGVNVNHVDAYGLTPLKCAASEGDVAMSAFLITKGAEINYKNPYTGTTALHGAVLKQHKTVVAFLMESGADPGVVSDSGQSPMHIAAFKADTDIVDVLLGDGTKCESWINLQDESGATALYLAALYGFTKTVKRLLECGANPALITLVGATPLHAACLNGYLDIVKLLITADPELVGCLRVDGFSPIMVAVSKGHIPIVDELCSSGADLSPDCRRQRSLAMLAAQNGHDELAKQFACTEELVAHKAIDGETLLMTAARYGRNKMIPFLLSMLADVSEVDADGMTAFLYAANGGNVVVMRQLLAFKANPLDVNITGENAAHIAAVRNSVEVLEFLQLQGCDLEARRYSDDATPLDLACSNGFTDFVRALLMLGVNPNLYLPQDDLSPLIRAASIGDSVMVKALIEAGANVIHATNKGVTAIAVASKNNYTSIIPLLSGVHTDGAGAGSSSHVLYEGSVGDVPEMVTPDKSSGSDHFPKG